jgi:hypothetical protein
LTPVERVENVGGQCHSLLEVHRLNQDDIVEVEGAFYAPSARSRKK